MEPESILSGTQLQQHPSPRHSPVPYLFGGLAAMLGLVSFALLILACSYWKFSSYLENSGHQNGHPTQESSDNGERPLESISVCRESDEQQIVVIMAGDQRPTFLARPIFSKGSPFANNKEVIVKSCCEEGGEKKQSDHEQESQGGER